MSKPWLCLLGVHRWQDQRNPETSERYITCARCSKDNDKISMNQPGPPGL